jgi:hypothetical protein
MATSARELVGWTDQRWTAVQDAVNKALARTAKCRQVIPKGADLIGAKTVPVQMVTGKPYELKDETTAPVYLSVDLQFDDQHSDDEAAILRLVESSAAELGKMEDETLLKAKGGIARNAKMVPWALATTKKITASVNLKSPNATDVLTAISDAVAELDGTANRPGPCGLILANELLAKLRQPVRAGDAPPMNQAEQLVGTNQIAGTSVLDGAKSGEACGVLLRLEPTAGDFVLTLLPSVAVVERTGGNTKLRVEEEIALRVLDADAIIRILVK